MGERRGTLASSRPRGSYPNNAKPRRPQGTAYRAEPPVVTPPDSGDVGGLSFNSSQSNTLGAPVCWLGAMVGRLTPVPVCWAIAASDSMLLLASKVPTAEGRTVPAGPAAQPSPDVKQRPNVSVKIVNA